MHELEDGDPRVSDRANTIVRRLSAFMQGQDYRPLDALADEALAEARASGETALFAVAAECRAQADYHLGRYPAALPRFVEAIERWRTVGDPVGEARSRLGHASLLATCGLTNESLEEGQAALAQVDESTDFALLFGALLAIARVQTTLRAWDEADRLYTRAVAAARARADDREIARGLVDLGYFHCERSRTARSMGDRTSLAESAQRSLECNREAVALCRSTAQTKLEWVALLNLGEALMDLDRLDEARTTTEDVLDQVRRAVSPNAHFEAEALLNLGQIALARRAFDEATSGLAQAFAIAKRQGMNELLMRSCELLTTAHEAQDDFRTALDFHKKFFVAHGEILSEAARLRAAILAVQYETVEARAAVTAERERSRSLVADNLALQRESLEDALTTLPNHRAFQRSFARFALEHAASGVEFFLAVLDVDDFKSINDRYSHATGDDVLKALGAILQRECRQGDLAARYGGEEFTLILRNCSRANALGACERIRRAIEQHDWSSLVSGLQVTVSVGLAGSVEHPMNANLFEAADRRLYRAKAAGKNRVVASDQ